MNSKSTPRQINIAALCVGAAGILILFVAIPDSFPAVPPGPIILLAAAGVVAFAPGRWTALVGVLVPSGIFIGGLANGTPDLLINPDNAAASVGIVIQLAALLTATTAGVIALRKSRACAPRVA